MHVTHQENGHPKVYRIDGPEMMQKFEPFIEDGILLYRGVDTVFHACLQYRKI